MSNRRIRSIIGPSLSIHELRRLALGEDIVRWCDTVEPQLRQEWDTLAAQSAAMMHEMDTDMQRLSLMHCETPADYASRATEMMRIQEMQERQTAIMERRVRTFGQLSAGGAASIWAAMQRGTARQQQDKANEERTVKPRRRFRLVEAESAGNSAASDHAQPVDAEVIAEDGD